MFCKHCGSHISDDSVFCQKCGKKQINNEENIKTESRTVKPEKSNFPNIKNQSVETGWNTGAILGALAAIGVVISSVSLLQYGDFVYIIMFALSIAIAIACIANIKKSYYRIVCPRCNKSTTFPCKAQSHDCDCCKSKLILQDNGDIIPFQ